VSCEYKSYVLIAGESGNMGFGSGGVCSNLQWKSRTCCEKDSGRTENRDFLYGKQFSEHRGRTASWKWWVSILFKAKFTKGLLFNILGVHTIDCKFAHRQLKIHIRKPTLILSVKITQLYTTDLKNCKGKLLQSIVNTPNKYVVHLSIIPNLILHGLTQMLERFRKNVLRIE